MQVNKQNLEPDREQTGFILGKEYVKAVYYHYLFLDLHTDFSGGR